MKKVPGTIFTNERGLVVLRQKTKPPFSFQKEFAAKEKLEIVSGATPPHFPNKR